MEFIKKYRYEFFLLATIIGGIFLRFYKLEYQSLWDDELFTLNLSDPSLSIKEMFQLVSQDPHPPLYVILSRISFTVFGVTPFAARAVSALSGSLCVLSMYYLGKTLINKKLGVIAAIFCSVNTFLIYLSQEGRDYMLLTLLSILSVLYFVKLCKEQRATHAAGFVLFTTLAIYTHYFGFLVGLSEAIFVFILMGYRSADKRKKLFAWFACSFLAVGLCYLPWLPFMLSLPKYNFNFWIPIPSVTFPFHYYYDYFGASIFIFPFLVVLPSLYLFYFLKKWRGPKELREDLLTLFFAFCAVYIVTGHVVPYIYSLVKSPIVTNRYLIFLLPIYIMLVAIGAFLIKNKMLQYVVVASFAIISITDVFTVKRFYSAPYKDQVRETTAFIARSNKNYPMINEWMAWRHQYYLKQFNYTGRILNYDGSIFPTRNNKEWMIDSILSKSKNYNVDTFWLLTIHADIPLSKEKRAALDTGFFLLREAQYLGSSAQLFGRKKRASL